MEINAHFNFIEGKTAEYLKNTLNLEFKTFRPIKFQDFKGLKANQIVFKNGIAFYKDGEDEYLMFYYLPKFKVKLWKTLPKYHVIQCETRNTYTGFVFANKMPVDIYSRDENKTYENQDLSLCRNCSKEVFKSWWGTDKPWYDSVLNFVSIQENPSFHISGNLKDYHIMWKQISEAYREKMGWKCENHGCQIDLSSKEDRIFLHTHHENGNTKDNREENFKALCLLCHGLEHPNKLVQGTGFFEVENFISRFRNKLSRINLSEFEKLKKE